MTDKGSGATPVFDVSVSVTIAAPTDTVYEIVSDMPRSGEWSTECQGGTWVSGTPGEVGAVFRGQNYRTRDVVAWAPVVRETWYTESQVIVAEPGRAFRWAMRDRAGRPQHSVWSFDIAAVGDATSLTHHFRMDQPTEGIRGIVADMTDTQRQRFFAEWSVKIGGDMAATIDRVKNVVEKTLAVAPVARES